MAVEPSKHPVHQFEMGIGTNENKSIKPEAENSASSNKDEETDWSSVRMVAVITFLSVMQMFVIGMSEWPYMQKLDVLSTATFFGYVGSISSLGHAICAPLMGYWSAASGSTRWPLIAGRIIALVGCLFYIFLEFFPSNRRYVMLFCYLLFGISMSSMSVLRGHIPKISTTADRAKACSLFGLALVLAVSIGPVFQLLFTPLAYPGLNILAKKLLLNIYTGPIYVAFIANVMSLILIIFFFEEKKIRRPETGLRRRPSRAKTALTSDLKQFSMPLALLCIFVRMTVQLSFVTIHTITSPLMMSVFGWTSTKTVKVTSITQALVGASSLVVYIGFATGKLSKFISMRAAALISLVLFSVYYLLTFPWPFPGTAIHLKNETLNVTGCDPVVYDWCLTERAVNPIVYLMATVTVLGIAVSFATISIDTLFSVILGKIDQGTMQGIFLFAMDIVNIGGPLLIAPIFDNTGQKFVWILDGVAVILAACFWAYNYSKVPKAKKH